MSIIYCVLGLIILLLAIPIVTAIATVLGYTLRYVTQKNKCAGLTRHPKTLLFYDLFVEDGLKRLLHDLVDSEGNLKAKSYFIGPHIDGTPTVFVNDAEHFKELLTEDKFPKLPMVYSSLTELIGDGLVTSTGELWARERKLLTPLFHFAKLKQMPEIMGERIDKFCDELRALNRKSQRASSLFGKLTLEIVIDCVFGGPRYLDSTSMDPLWEAANLAANQYILTYMLFGDKMNRMLPFPWNLKLFSTMNKVRSMIDRAIELKKHDMKSQDSDEDTDLLASLLNVRDSETGEPIPDKLIRDEALTFLFAGHDTTSALLSWCMDFLSRNPEVVSRIREEITSVMGERTRVTFDDLKKFSYVEMVLKETLRMRPPVPLLDREVKNDITLGDFTHKAGTYIYPVFIASHFNNQYWKEPFKFRPERFDPARKNEEPVAHNFAYVPFSAGSRNCIGKKFSIMEAKIAVVSIMRQFDVVTEQTPEEIVWHFEGTMKPVNFHCSFVPLSDD